VLHKSRRRGVFSNMRCTRKTAAAAPQLTPSCFFKSIDDQIFTYFVTQRMLSNIHENDHPMKVSYAARSPRGRLKISMEKTDLTGQMETTQE